ncbi:MAG: type II toxin-antitoxin system RelE/ParE family toxin [Salinivirgaceae bacterium]
MDKIIWTDSAIQDLNDIGDYIAKDSEKYAQITVNKLFDSVDILELYPLTGKMVPELNDDSIPELPQGNYRVVYQIID